MVFIFLKSLFLDGFLENFMIYELITKKKINKLSDFEMIHQIQYSDKIQTCDSRGSTQQSSHESSPRSLAASVSILTEKASLLQGVNNAFSMSQPSQSATTSTPFDKAVIHNCVEKMINLFL